MLTVDNGSDLDVLVKLVGDRLAFKPSKCCPPPCPSTDGNISVGLALPENVFGVSGSPVTSVGTLTGSFIPQLANYVFAGPATGVNGLPTFRPLTLADLPTLPTPDTDVPISSLLPAVATNTINNANFLQYWQWNSLTGTGLRLAANSTTAAANVQTVFAVDNTGVNFTGSQTTYAARFTNTHSGITSRNVGIDVSASGGTDGINNNIAAILTAPSGAFGFAPILSIRNGAGHSLDFNVHTLDSYIIPTGNKVVVTKGFSLFASIHQQSNLYFGSSASGLLTTEPRILIEAQPEIVSRGRFDGTSTATTRDNSVYANIIFGPNHVQVGTETTSPFTTNVLIKKQDIYLEDLSVVTNHATLYVEGDHNLTNLSAVGASVTNTYAVYVANGKTALGAPTGNVASAKLSVNSITQGFAQPRMNTGQKNAIVSPLTGLMVFDTTLNQPCYYDGAVWVCGWSGGGGGSVTTLSVVTANGFAGTVTNPTTTPAITLTTSVTGLLKGNGTAISAATVGTDYSIGTSALATGILKSTTTTGALSIAVAGDFPTLNQNTTGSAATLTTPRNIQGVAFNGSANIDVINGTGFVKATGTTLSYDNSTYLTTASAAATYQPLDGDLTIVATIGTALQQIRVNAGGTALEYFTASGGGVTSVSGTTNRITSTGGTTPIIDISATFEALLGKVASPLSQFAATTSTQLAGVISDATGSGALVFATSPTFVTPALGTPTSATLTNATGLPIIAGTTGTLSIARGGTNATSQVTNGVNYFDGTNIKSLATFLFDGTNLGIGVTPQSILTVARQTTIVAPVTGSTAQFVGLDANPLRITFDTHNNANASGTALMGRRSRGTAGTPLALATDDVLFSINGRGYGTTGYGAASTGLISINAAQTFTDANQGTYVSISTTPNNSVTAAEALRITGAGVLNIFQAAGVLQINSIDVLTNNALTIGTTGGTIGTLNLRGNTSGTAIITPAAAAGTPTLTLPTTTDTLVGRATTDTLTNKTLSAGVITTTAAVQTGTNASGNGVIPYEYHILVRADETLANVNTDQDLFTGTHNSIAVLANTTYKFDFKFDLTHGATSHALSFGMTPTTATITNIAYNALAWVTAVGTSTATQNSVRVKATTTTQIIAAAANATETVEGNGWFTVGATGGSIAPQIKFSADPTGTILLKAGAEFHIYAIGNDTFTENGPIS